MRRLSPYLVLVLAFAVALPIHAAEQHRPLSPRGQASTQVLGKWVKQENGHDRYTGGKWIDIDYGRPILRGRQDIFGSGADYGKQVDSGAKVWRLGANQTTQLTTEATLKLGDTTLAPGTYSLFVGLENGSWTLIVSRQPFQQKYDRDDKTATWGAYNYDSKMDVVRVPMQVEKTDHSVDQLTISFLDVNDQGGTLAVAWQNTQASVHFGLVP